MNDATSMLIRGGWILTSILAAWLCVIGYRGARADVAAVRAAGKNGLMILVSTARVRRWLVRGVIPVTMLVLSVLTFLAPGERPKCPDGSPPPSSQTGVAIVFGLMMLGFWQVVVFADDILSRQQIDQYAVDQLLRDEPDAPTKGS
jgi:hypothetical protein